MWSAIALLLEEIMARKGYWAHGTSRQPREFNEHRTVGKLNPEIFEAMQEQVAKGNIRQGDSVTHYYVNGEGAAALQSLGVQGFEEMEGQTLALARKKGKLDFTGFTQRVEWRELAKVCGDYLSAQTTLSEGMQYIPFGPDATETAIAFREEQISKQAALKGTPGGGGKGR